MKYCTVHTHLRGIQRVFYSIYRLHIQQEIDGTILVVLLLSKQKNVPGLGNNQVRELESPELIISRAEISCCTCTSDSYSWQVMSPIIHLVVLFFFFPRLVSHTGSRPSGWSADLGLGRQLLCTEYRSTEHRVQSMYVQRKLVKLGGILFFRLLSVGYNTRTHSVHTTVRPGRNTRDIWQPFFFTE